MSDQVYATLADMVHDLELSGVGKTKEARTLDRLRAASEWIMGKCGLFIPVTETRRYDSLGGKMLFVDPLLAVTSITDDTTTLTTNDYLLYPRNRHWVNGPYTRIEIDPDASALATWSCKRDAIAITGRWGKYEESVATGATVQNTTKIAAAGTSLKVDNGSLVSPGMVLLIESEQMIITATESPIAAVSLLAADMAIDAVELTVDNGAEFSVGEVIQVDTEDMRIEAIGGNVLGVTRKWNETESSAHANDATINVYRQYTVKRGCNGTTAADHANGVAISRYIAPWDINWLTRQIAGLMYKKAKGGFAGKTGNAELGEVMYHDEFPKKQIADVIRHYQLVSI
jgi:hypothetical protein